MKLLIVDDHQLVLEAIKSFLMKRLPNFEISAVSSPNAALDFVSQNPDLSLLICDMNMEGKINGTKVVSSALKENPALKVIVLSMHSERALVKMAFSSGARGYVIKTDPPEEIFRAISEVTEGKTFVSNSLSFDVTRGSAATELTSRELEIAEMVAGGKTSKEIAKDLAISSRTVEVHRRNVMNKLGVENVAQMVQVLSASKQ